MTFRSPRLLFLAVPALVAVGIAAACGPTPRPGCPSCNIVAYTDAGTVCAPMIAQPPTTPQAGAYYYEPVPGPQGQTYYAPRFAPVSPAAGTTLTAAGEKLHLQGSDGSRTTCEKFTILVSGGEPVDVSVDGKVVRMTSGKDVKDGDILQATARKVTRTGSEGTTLVLEGDGKLVYVRKGKKIDVSTDLLSVNLSTGQVISELNAPTPMMPPPPTPAVRPTDAPPVPATVPPVEPLTSPRPLRGAGQELRTNGPLPSDSAPPVLPR
jgi:hypothetical protein